MEWMFAFIWVFTGIIGMEVFSWWFHKYLMHGVFWKVHKTHHQHSAHWFELNDLFTVLFGGISVGLIFWGLPQFSFQFWIGLGISLYGLIYFILHDLLIHKRIKVFKRPTHWFLEGILKAHQAHHRKNTKEDSESFGLLFVDRKFFSKKN